jgi:hypothetical protein
MVVIDLTFSHLPVGRKGRKPTQEVLEEFTGLAAGLEHFPVSGQKWFSAHIPISFYCFIQFQSDSEYSKKASKPQGGAGQGAPIIIPAH